MLGAPIALGSCWSPRLDIRHDQEVAVAKVSVGHDWAEAHHDVHIEDGEQRRLAKARLPEGVEGVARFHELVAPFVEDPAEVVIATETDALPGTPFDLRAKSDPGDALVLAELARTDAHNHRPSPVTAS
ncbi:MAG: IS110 family transposase, partial [Actinobacteria bacterium]|nr:IS110 family transposase [Actinomycetota bacterium]